jgi:hypothetical protein
MARSRFTVVDLRSDIAKINGWLESEGAPFRLETGGRNGYQAVDEYPVDSAGSRIGTGVNRNVECGSSKDCSLAAFRHYGAWVQSSR